MGAMAANAAAMAPENEIWPGHPLMRAIPRAYDRRRMNVKPVRARLPSPGFSNSGDTQFGKMGSAGKWRENGVRENGVRGKWGQGENGVRAPLVVRGKMGSERR